ncbi:36626_t:CDS:1, partial [Racocetra persica]
RQSFILSKKLYNPINGQKGIKSNIIVSYTNANSRYDLLKESLKKSVISAVGRLKLSPN